MKVLKEYPEKINLYGIEKTRTTGGGYTPDGVFMAGFSNIYMEYYVDKGKGGAVTKLTSDDMSLGGNKKFRKTAIKFFNDCPPLTKKIEAKEFNRRKNVVDIVEFYANYCQ